jgi:hypothetical protein
VARVADACNPESRRLKFKLTHYPIPRSLAGELREGERKMSDMDIVEELETHAKSAAKASKLLAIGKMARNEAAGDAGATYDHALPEQTVEGRAAAEIKRLRARLEEIASQCHNLPRSATADRICDLTKLEK